MIRFKFGEIISAKKIRQIDISHETGISRNTLSALANNNTDMIRLETVDLLCSHLGITPCEFFEYYPGELKVTVETNFIDEISEYSVMVLASIKTKDKLYKATFSGYFESDEEATSRTGQKSIKGKLQQDDTQENVEWRNFVWVELSPGLQYDISESIEKEIAFVFEKDYGYSQKNVIIAPINLFY